MREITDRKFVNVNNLFCLILEENRSQLQKWGVQTHTPAEWMLYTTEELGELARAISEYEYRQGDKENVINEAIQVATLALKIAEMYL